MIHKFYILLTIVLLGLLGFTTYKYNNASSDIVLLNDSIKTHVLKNGELVSSKYMSEIKLKDLKTINDSLYDQIKQLKEDVVVVERIKMVYKTDTIFMESKIDSVITNDERKYIVKWNHLDLNDNLHINGKTSISFNNDFSVKNYYTTVDDLSLDIELVGVMTKTKHGIKYNVIPKSKNIRISNIDGYVIDNYKTKPKKFGLSLFTGPTYDFINNKSGFSVGFGVTYDVLQLF